MWIKMKDNYIGGIDNFHKSLLYDLPPEITNLLPKGSFEKIRAPWDEQRDFVAIKIAELKKAIAFDKKSIELLKANILKNSQRQKKALVLFDNLDAIAKAEATAPFIGSPQQRQDQARSQN